MKEYIRSRIIIFIEFVIVITSIFVMTKTNSKGVELLTSATSENMIKALDRDTIVASQKELYDEGIYNPLYTFTGELTGYAGDCPLCTGYLACPPRTNVLKDGIYYTDKTYGTLRIVASSKNYPCGTIIKFKVNKLSSEPIIAIILDRGVRGNAIDLLTESEDYARKNVGRVKNLEIEVLREGWTR